MLKNKVHFSKISKFDFVKRYSDKIKKFFKRKTQNNIETKDQEKLNYLRHVREDRQYQQWKASQEKKLKEASSMIFKKNQKTNLNQTYHDRLALEDAFRLLAQKSTETRKNIQLKNEQKRELTNAKQISLNKSVNDDNLERLRNSILARY